jgi:hypothetical protein
VAPSLFSTSCLRETCPINLSNEDVFGAAVFEGLMGGYNVSNGVDMAHNEKEDLDRHDERPEESAD